MKQCLMLLLLLAGGMAKAQNVGIGTTTPNNSALLDVNSVNKGVLIPRMTAAQRTALVNPPEGLIVFQTNNDAILRSNMGLHIFQGGSWERYLGLGEKFWSGSASRRWVYNTADSIGIGTLSPVAKLHVDDGSIFLQDTRAGQHPHLIFDVPADNGKEAGLQFKRNADTLAAIKYLVDPVYPHHLKFSVSNAGKGNDLIISNDGNIGMGGIVDPVAALNVRNRNQSGANAIVVDGIDPVLQFRNQTLGLYFEKGFMQLVGNDLRVGTNTSNNLGKFIIRTNGHESLISDPDGEIGIMEPNPQAPLHIKNPTGASSTLLLENSDPTIQFKGAIAPSITPENLAFVQTAGRNIRIGTNDGNTTGQFVVRMNGTDQVFVNAAGNMGIGNANTFARLGIWDGNDAGLNATTSGYVMLGPVTGSNLILDNNEIMVRNGGNAAGTLSLQNDGGELAVGARTTITKDGEALKLDGVNPSFNLYQNGVFSSRIVQDGQNLRVGVNGASIILDAINTGVGTSTPDSRLHVNGRTLITTNGEALQINGTNTLVNFNEGAINRGFIYQSGTRLMIGEQGSSGIINLAASQIAVGNVVPAASDYRLTVTGKVICEELKVRLSNAWPDYVFDDNYKLRNYEELRQYIASNKHLPGIPAAAEVEKNGLEVGDMQKRMMEKMEELTLYILELEQRIKVLEAGKTNK